MIVRPLFYFLENDFFGFCRKSPKHRDTADQISLRVFRVRQKQNILGPSTQRDLFKNAIVY